MSDGKPNVTVIYQDVKPPAVGCGAIIIEALVFLAFVFLVGGGCLFRWWL